MIVTIFLFSLIKVKTDWLKLLEILVFFFFKETDLNSLSMCLLQSLELDKQSLTINNVFRFLAASQFAINRIKWPDLKSWSLDFDCLCYWRVRGGSVGWKSQEMF